MNQRKTNPFLYSTIFYLLLGLLAAVQAMLLLWEVLDPNPTTTWVRIHFITIGVLTQLLVGFIPKLVHTSSVVRWDIWILLNTGLFLFFYGRSLLRNDLMVSGGVTLIITLILFTHQLISLKGEKGLINWFYITASLFLIIGIVMGMAIWNNWNDYLHIGSLLEVHIHANNWGFLNLCFSALMYELFPSIFSIEGRWEGSMKWVFILQVFGALGLVIGPWVSILQVIVIGMILFLAGTIILLLNFTLPLRGKEKQVGFYHILSAYIWIFIPLFFAPFVLFSVPGFEHIESMAPQALIYGWVLQVGFAFLPFFIESWIGKESKLGGNYFSLLLVNLGSIMLWISIFAGSLRDELHGVAYALWTLSIVPIFIENFRILQNA